MRVRTKSACVVLAWGTIVVIVAVTAGLIRPDRPPRADDHARSNTSSSNSATRFTAVTVAAVTRHAPRPAAGYTVQPGDTLSGIAVALAVPGGWPALYAANRRAIGPDPGLIRPGIVLVIPRRAAPARYTVAAGDTLAGIAAALAVPGGWPALYAANHRAIGRDPALIHPGTVLVIPHPVAPRAPGYQPGSRLRPEPPPSGPAAGPSPQRARTPEPQPATGMPPWLTVMLLTAGLVAAAAFLAEPVLLIHRRRRRAAGAGAAAAPPAPTPKPVLVPLQLPAQPGSGGGAAGSATVVLADYARVVVTYSETDHAAYVLRPPEQDPAAILAAARLVLPEGSYRDLASQLGVPASWPIVVADYDRVVVTCSARDGTVCVLRPPGEDPAAVLTAARLVLPEEPYQELAEQLGVPAGLPMGGQCG